MRRRRRGGSRSPRSILRVQRPRAGWCDLATRWWRRRARWATRCGRSLLLKASPPRSARASHSVIPCAGIGAEMAPRCREMPRDALGNRRPPTHTGHTHPGHTHTLDTFPCIASKCCEKALAAKNLQIGDRTPATPNAQVRLRLRRTEAIGPWATELWEAGRGERDALSPEALRAYRAQACTVVVVVVVVGHALRAYRAQACTVAVVVISARSRRDLSRWRPPRAVPRRSIRDAPHGRGDARGAVCCLCATASPARRAPRCGCT